ncbi:MAG: hypothetical protein V4482_00150 [Pseudomonadota bacterium]
MIKRIITAAVLSSALCVNAFSANLVVDVNDENRIPNGQTILVTPEKKKSLAVESWLESGKSPAELSMSPGKLPRKPMFDVTSRNMHVTPQGAVLTTVTKGKFDVDSALKLNKNEPAAAVKQNDSLVEIVKTKKFGVFSLREDTPSAPAVDMDIDVPGGFYHQSEHNTYTSSIRSTIRAERKPGNFASFELSLIGYDGADEVIESYTSNEKFVSGLMSEDTRVLSCEQYMRAYIVPEGEDERACSELALLGYLDERIGHKIESMRAAGVDLRKIVLTIHSERDLCFNCKRVVPAWAKEKSALYECNIHVIALSQLDYCTPSSPCCDSCPYKQAMVLGKKKKKEALAVIAQAKVREAPGTPKKEKRSDSLDSGVTDSEDSDDGSIRMSLSFARVESTPVAPTKRKNEDQRELRTFVLDKIASETKRDLRRLF